MKGKIGRPLKPCLDCGGPRTANDRYGRNQRYPICQPCIQTRHRNLPRRGNPTGKKGQHIDLRIRETSPLWNHPQ